MAALILVKVYCKHVLASFCSSTKFCNTSAFLYIPVKLFADAGEQIKAKLGLLLKTFFVKI